MWTNLTVSEFYITKLRECSPLKWINEWIIVQVNQRQLPAQFTNLKKYRRLFIFDLISIKVNDSSVMLTYLVACNQLILE